ncbi:hypothetical protein [Nocardioides insulae]|uniref:hypothetical protein n=1 Tax=Nocardioides insulae TaxID=394734 RepID=UPI00042343EC|nr:hypothetical protein [Nocardioides insulae]
MANSHKRDTNARRTPRAGFIAAPLALLATGVVVGTGVLSADPASTGRTSATADRSQLLEHVDRALQEQTEEREPALSRSFSRLARAKVVDGTEVERDPADLLMAPAAVRTAIAGADTRLWATEELNLWDLPGEDATNVGLLEEGDQVTVTGREFGGREEIVVDGASRWVTSGYFDDEEPTALGGECTNGTSVPAGVDPSIELVHQAVCANWPEVSTYGTFRSDGEHGEGRAVDIMISGQTGWDIAEFLRANYADLGIEYLIYSQQIWSVERSGEGWRGMSDRGSTTANHYDHVHVTVY